MSFTLQNVKLGLEQNGETKYLSEIVVDGERISYQLSEQGQVYPGSEARVLLPLLAKAEPNHNFVVVPA